MDRLDAAWAFPDWPLYAARLAEAVTGLTDEQLALRAGPAHGPVWALAAHTAGSRLYWLCVVCGEPGLEGLDVINPDTLEGWEDRLDRPRSGEELQGALDGSWAVVADCLARWTPAQLAEPVERRYLGKVQHYTRISILNRLFSHDAFHAGEISQVLGVAGLEGIDLWRRAPVPRSPRRGVSR